MTPNMGQGGNSAIESAAILSNCIKSALDKNPQGPNSKQIDESLSLYQSERRKRIKTVYTRASDTTRMEAMDSLTKIIMARYIIPSLGEKLILKMVGDLLKDAPTLDFVEKPTRAHLIPYTDEKPKKKSILGF
jgi:FAD dependent monooxygenase